LTNPFATGRRGSCVITRGNRSPGLSTRERTFAIWSPLGGRPEGPCCGSVLLPLTEYRKFKRPFPPTARAHPAPPEATSQPCSRPRGRRAGRPPRAARSGAQAQAAPRRLAEILFRCGKGQVAHKSIHVCVLRGKGVHRLLYNSGSSILIPPVHVRLTSPGSACTKLRRRFVVSSNFAVFSLREPMHFSAAAIAIIGKSAAQGPSTKLVRTQCYGVFRSTTCASKVRSISSMSASRSSI
jgi:hypothetical protein